MNGISIVICCYNSAKRISETLKFIALQNVSPSIPWEVIVVNNNSSDATKELAAAEWKKYKVGIPFKIVDEMTPGLSAARGRGFEATSYELVILCDDDNWLHSDYVQTAYELMNLNPAIGVLGGRIEAVCESEPPLWFHQFNYAYAVGEQSSKEGDISDRQFVWGAGMVIRKIIWKNIQLSGYKTSLSDRKGTSLNSGGDSELSLLSLLLGFKLWYSPRLLLKHYIPGERLNWDYVKALMKGFGASDTSLVSLKYLLLIKNNQLSAEYRLSWKKELLKIISLLLRHPKKLVKGISFKEGEPSVTWLIYYLSYVEQFLKMKSSADKNFVLNYDLLLPKHQKEK